VRNYRVDKKQLNRRKKFNVKFKSNKNIFFL